MKVLVVEGQRQATDDVVASMHRKELTVVRGVHRDNAPSLIHQHDPQVVVLVAIPFQGWYLQLLRDLQGWERTPYTLAVATIEPSDQVALLEAGADTCCAYPEAVEVCEAQVLALERRANAPVAAPVAPEVVHVRELVVDFTRYQVMFAGESLAVTPAEFRILACLAQRAGKVVPTTELFHDAMGYEVSSQQAKDILKVHVRRIRNKIRDIGGSSDYIWNIRGFGYLLERRARGGQTFESEEEEVEEAPTA